LIKKQYNYSDEEMNNKISAFLSTQTEHLAGLGSRFELWLDEENEE
jgi:hypothetical protein